MKSFTVRYKVRGNKREPQRKREKPNKRKHREWGGGVGEKHLSNGVYTIQTLVFPIRAL